MVRRVVGRPRQPSLTRWGVIGLAGAGVLLTTSCATPEPIQARPHRGATPTREATSDACILTPPRTQVLGMPLVDATTVRIAPDVIGETLTWRAGPRRVTAWVGVDALDAFEDLDFVAVELPRADERRQWTTKVRPDFFVAEVKTGHVAPCDVLYVSTEGLPGRAALDVLSDLEVALTTQSAVQP